MVASYASVMKPMRITQTLLLASLAVVVVGCSSDMDDRQPRSYPGAGEGERRGTFARTGGAGDGLDMVPPADWWRDPKISVAMALTNDQTAALDRIGHEQGEEVAKLERDSQTAMRDLRQLVDSSQPVEADIVAAGQRLRGIRDVLFDRRVQMLAAERTLLTQSQWETLQQQLAARNRPERTDRGGYGGRGGRGGMGGRGRFPG
jgi:Spy/CpxP family protein refolding chaperone